MLCTKDVPQAIALGELFTLVDLKDVYFYVPIAPHHRQFLCFSRLALSVQSLSVRSLFLSQGVNQLRCSVPLALSA